MNGIYGLSTATVILGGYVEVVVAKMNKWRYFTAPGYKERQQYYTSFTYKEHGCISFWLDIRVCVSCPWQSWLSCQVSQGLELGSEFKSNTVYKQVQLDNTRNMSTINTTFFIDLVLVISISRIIRLLEKSAILHKRQVVILQLYKTSWINEFNQIQIKLTAELRSWYVLCLSILSHASK